MSFKIIKNAKDDYNGTSGKEFAEDKLYYIFSEKTIVPLQNSKGFVIALMKDKEPAVQQYLITITV
jgi:hypothetical protein